MIKAIALDDEPPALDIVAAFCKKVEGITLVKTFTNAGEAGKFLEAFPVDLLFLDIQMPAISGIAFKKKIPPQTGVVFCTAYSEFAVEAFDLNAVDYLLKPFTLERFVQAVEKAKAYHRFLHQSDALRADAIFVRADYSLVKVALDDILFIEGLDDYVKFHLQGQKPVVTRTTLKALYEKLPHADFIRVHRSFIVPVKKVEAVRNKIIFIAGKELPVGTRFEKAFFEKFKP